MGSLFREVKGCIHIHSEYSPDAWAPVEHIAAAAAEAGLDFVLLTDHDTLGALEAGKEGWYGPVLVAAGMEVTPPVNHYLAFGLREVVPKTGGPQAVIDAVRARGGFGFLAHPFSPGTPLVPGSRAPWTDWSVRGFCGLEVWTFMDDFMDQVQTLADAARYFQEPDAAIGGPFPQTLETWDRLSRAGRVVGVGGLDAHAFRLAEQVGRLGLGHAVPPGYEAAVIFPYRQMFQTIRTRVLVDAGAWPSTDPGPGSARAAIDALYAGLRAGRCTFGYFPLGDFAGLAWEPVAEGEPCGVVGAEASYRPGLVLRARVPAPCHVRVLRDGNPVYEGRISAGAEWPAPGPGAYRLECHVPHEGRLRPWAFTNHVYLR